MNKKFRSESSSKLAVLSFKFQDFPSKEGFQQSIYFSQEQNYYSIAQRNLNRNCDLPFLFKKTAMTTEHLISEKDEGDRMKRYAELLMPLVFETWMEVRPTAKSRDDDIQISNEAAYTLKTILEIIEKLYELMQFWDRDVNNNDLTNWFKRKYNKDFCLNFLAAFPYEQGDGFKGSKRKSKGTATEQEVHESGGQKCNQQNLNIAYIFCSMNVQVSTGARDLTERIIRYLKSKNRNALKLRGIIINRPFRLSPRDGQSTSSSLRGLGEAASSDFAEQWQRMDSSECFGQGIAEVRYGRLPEKQICQGNSNENSDFAL